MNGFEEIGQNDHFGGKMAIFGPFFTKNGENEIFSQKSENVTSFTFISHNFVQKIRKILWVDLAI